MRPWLAIVVALGACGDDGATGDDARPDDAMTIDGTPQPPPHRVVYISGYGPNIAWFDFNDAFGTLVPVSSVASFAQNPSFLAMTQTHLYAAAEGGNRVGAYEIDQSTGALTFINDVSSSGNGPAHISVDNAGAYALVANYTAGNVAVLPIRSDGGVMAATQTVSAGANAHQIITDASNDYVLVPCKGDDWVAQYTFANGTLTPNAAPRVTTTAGAGPRHIAFSPDGEYAYLVNENNSTLTSFVWHAPTGVLSALGTVSTRAAGATGANTGAEVVVHPSGRFVYASNRGDDNIAVFRIVHVSGGDAMLVGHVPTGGRTPRSFAIDPTGQWMFVANQATNNVVKFEIDATTGMPTATGTSLTVESPSFVGFVALPPR